MQYYVRNKDFSLYCSKYCRYSEPKISEVKFINEVHRCFIMNFQDLDLIVKKSCFLTVGIPFSFLYIRNGRCSEECFFYYGKKEIKGVEKRRDAHMVS